MRKWNLFFCCSNSAVLQTCWQTENRTGNKTGVFVAFPHVLNKILYQMRKRIQDQKIFSLFSVTKNLKRKKAYSSVKLHKNVFFTCVQRIKIGFCVKLHKSVFFTCVQRIKMGFSYGIPYGKIFRNFKVLTSYQMFKLINNDVN